MTGTIDEVAPYRTPGTHVVPPSLRDRAPGRSLPADLAALLGCDEAGWAAARFGPNATAPPANVWQPLRTDLVEFHDVPLFSSCDPAVVASALADLVGPVDRLVTGRSRGRPIVNPDLFLITLPLATRTRRILAAMFGRLHLSTRAFARMAVSDLLSVRTVGPLTALDAMAVVGDAVERSIIDRSAPQVAPQPWALPSSLTAIADLITGDDPRFDRWIPPGQSLTEAAGRLSVEDGAELEAYIVAIEGRPIEDAVLHLIEAACSAGPTRHGHVKRGAIRLTDGWREAFGARYGLDGSPPVTLEAAAALVPSSGPTGHVTRERIRQQTAKLEARLPRSAWIPALHRSLPVLVESSPVAVDGVGDVLLPLGLSRRDLSADTLLSLMELTGTDCAAVTGTQLVIRDNWLVDERESDVVSASSVVARHTSTYGMTTVEEVRQQLSTEEQPADAADVERVLRADPQVRWSPTGWLWADKHDVASLHTNSLRNCVRKMLSVNAPQDVYTLHEGLVRVQKFRQRDIVPPVEAMADFLAAHPEFTIDGVQVSPVTPLSHRDALGDVASQIVEVFQNSPFGVMDRQTLYDECVAAGIKPATFGVWTTYAEWMQNYGRNVWGPRGLQVSPAVVEEIQRAARTRTAGELRRKSWSWTSDGGVQLVADITTNVRTAGVISFDASLRHTLGARRFQIETPARVGMLCLAGDHDWTWGWGRTLTVLDAHVGQVIRAVLDLAAGTARIEIGGADLFPDG